MAGDISIESMGKMALVPPKEEKGELSMGLMVMSGEKSKDYSALLKNQYHWWANLQECRR